MLNFCKKITPWIGSVVAVVVILSWSTDISASVYTGNGLFSGINTLAGVGGISNATSITALIFKLIAFILNIVLLLAVAAIIIAGIYLIVSNGDEGSKDKAKTIVFYAIAGIILILFSRLIVIFVNNIFD